jgi:hypothetical protein
MAEADYAGPSLSEPARVSEPLRVRGVLAMCERLVFTCSSIKELPCER